MPDEFQRRIVSFAARRIFCGGVELADHDYRAQPYEPGTLTLYFHQDRKGVPRAVARFVKLSGANACDIFPPLWSPRSYADSRTAVICIGRCACPVSQQFRAPIH
jgi:hypothetical protein